MVYGMAGRTLSGLTLKPASACGGMPPPAHGGGTLPHRFPKYITDPARDHGVRYDLLEVDESSMYSSLMPYHFEQVSRIYKEEMGGSAPQSIVDATAHIGCDTIHFRRMFPRAQITAVEIDPSIARILKTNMVAMPSIIGQADPEPVVVRAMDAIQYLVDDPETIDLVYFDPPWGGPEYLQESSITLMVNDQPLGLVLGRIISERIPLIVVKMPVNVDLAEFKKGVSARVPVNYKLHNVVRPKKNRKGAIAYRLLFVRIRR